MKHKKHRQARQYVALRIRITLDVGAASLGVGEGFRFDSDGKKRKKNNRPAQDGGFTMVCRDLPAAANGTQGVGTVEITARRAAAEWEHLSQSDCFRYADAVAAGYLSQIRDMTGMDLAPHIADIAVETPLSLALCEPDADECLRAKAERLFPARQQMAVAGVTNAVGVVTLDLRKTDRRVAASFRAGQSVRLFLPDVVVTAALCSSPALTKEGRYTVAATAEDARLSALRVGDTLDVSAPEGAFFYTPLRDHRTVIGLADAAGLGLFLSMASALRDHAENFKLTVLYADGDGEVPSADEWEALCAVCGKARLICLAAADVTAESLKAHLPHEAYSVFISGAPAFCDAAAQALSPLGLPRKAVRRQTIGLPSEKAAETP